MRAVVTGRHLYGYGGGAQATLMLAQALKVLGYDVAVHGQMPISVDNLQTLSDDGITFQLYYKGCSQHADLLLNVDHFEYEPPLAKVNLAHVFHPTGKNTPDEATKAGYRWSANSGYTAHWMNVEWGVNAPCLYVPVNKNFYQSRKVNMILHVSRFVRPTEYQDKGHADMIRAFQQMCDAGLKDWEFIIAGSIEEPQYANFLQSVSYGYPVRFFGGITDQTLRELYAKAAFYWHASGVSFPGSHAAQEHLGLTTIEAMASGAVPVVYGSGGQPEIVMPDINGVLCQNTYTMQAVTMDLIGNLSEWAHLSQGAIRTAQPWQDFNAFVTRVAAWIENQPIPEMKFPLHPANPISPQDVCVVIPTCGKAEYLRGCLKSLFKTTPDVGQVVVVESPSDEDLRDCWHMLREGDTWITPGEKFSFAKANQQALAYTDKSYLLACNNDIVFIEPGWLERMLVAMQDDVGVVGAKLIYPSGRLQHAGGIIDWNRADMGFHRWYGHDDFPGASQTEEVPFVTGALLLARRALWLWPIEWDGIGCEDADLCLNARLEGYKVVYQPSARAVHYESITRLGVDWNQEATSRNREAFVEKWDKEWRKLYPYWQLSEGGSIIT